MIPARARAQGATPRLHHAPISVSTAHRALLITGEIEHPELVKRALVAYRTADSGPFQEVEFRRGAPGPYVAEIPEAAVTPPELSYVIEIEDMDGARRPVFASRAEPHHVLIPEDLMDARERALLARLGGRRSVFAASGEYVDFGYSKAVVSGSAGLSTQNVHDEFFRVEGSYTYRPLRFVTEFSLRVGAVRGNSPVPLSATLAPGKSEADRFKVGLNYGAPTVRLRLSDIVHLEGEFLTSVTETGFSVGTGASVLVGDPYGSKLTLGFESIQVFGTRLWSRLDIIANSRIGVAPVIEVTNMPHADNYGVRLLGEVSGQLGQGFSAAARAGYQARVSTGGGPSAGATLAYSF
ncbi:MAG: hypothetical protein ABJB12_16615 [Pseudomonadota bacterium]